MIAYPSPGQHEDVTRIDTERWPDHRAIMISPHEPVVLSQPLSRAATAGMSTTQLAKVAVKAGYRNIPTKREIEEMPDGQRNALRASLSDIVISIGSLGTRPLPQTNPRTNTTAIEALDSKTCNVVAILGTLPRPLEEENDD